MWLKKIIGHEFSSTYRNWPNFCPLVSSKFSTDGTVFDENGGLVEIEKSFDRGRIWPQNQFGLIKILNLILFNLQR